MTKHRSDLVPADTDPLAIRRLEQGEAVATLVRTMYPDATLGPLFIAVQEAVEEAILNSLFMAETIVGYRGHVRHAAPRRTRSSLGCAP